jgi:inorganic triphosphatase YgiF
MGLEAGSEVELKLEFPPGDLRDLAELPGLSDLVSGPMKREMLTSVYFDTKKLKLRGRGFALRIRHIGNRRLQTFKAIQKGGHGPLGRDEWEEEVNSVTPDLSLAKGTALAPLDGKKLRRALRPLFETVVERLTLSVHYGTSEVEVALDRGWVKAGGDCDAINEMELELKRGDLDDLAEIAKRLAHAIPLTYAARSKQDRGFSLIAGEKAGAVGAAKIMLDAQSSTGDAFRVIALACLDHAMANARAVCAGNAEGIHQMRVGLRRLRATLTLFKPLIETAEADTIKTELKWLTEQLAPARDYEVFVTEGVGPLRDHGPEAETRLLTEDLERKREQGLGRAKSAVESDRFRALGLQTALWILAGEWRRRDDEMMAALCVRPAADFAAESLARHMKRVLRKARRVEQIDPRGRHKLRIAVKKLRYATDFFGGLFGRKHRRTRFNRHLKALQGALGRLNDIEVHKRVADNIVHGERVARRADRALAIGFVSGYEHTQIKPCIDAVKKMSRRLTDIPPFWE